MKIPQKLPQFEKFPALFIASGEYEARFYLAEKGDMLLKASINMPPREEAREKQAFVGIKGGRYGLAAVSHHGAYIDDLKNKFHKKFHTVMEELLAEHELKEIYIFAPRYVAGRIMKELNKSEQKDVRMQFYQEETKANPLDMIRKFWQTEQEIIHPKLIPGNRAKKILANPNMRSHR